MIELIRERDLTNIGPIQGMLEDEGIRTFIRNENLSVLEVTIPKFYPALCIVDEKDHARALEILRQFQEPAAGDVTEEVICQNCGEQSPGTFAECWNCGQPLS